MKKNSSEKLISIVFSIVGIAIIILGIFMQINNNNFMKTAVKTEATITELSTYTDSDGDTSHHVEVSFVVDSQTYGGPISEYSFDMQEGGTTTIYYNPENPNNFKGPSTNFIGYIVAGFGSIFFLIGGIMIFVSIKKKNLYKNLKVNGRRIDTQITSVDLNQNYAVNGKHPFVISSTYTENGIVYNFKSDNIWVNVEQVLVSNGITTIPVYMDSNNPSKYVMDIEELSKYIGN